MIGRELDKETSFLNVVLGNLFQIRNHYITFLTLVKLTCSGWLLLKVIVDYLGSIKQALGLKQAEQLELKEEA